MLLDPFYGVYGTSTKIAHFMNRLLLVAEFGTLAFLIYKLAKLGGLPVWGWIGVCAGGVLAIHLVNVVVRFVWNVILTLFFGTTDADEIDEAHTKKMQRRRLREEERQRRIEEAELRRARKNRIAIEKEWNECHSPSFED